MLRLFVAIRPPAEVRARLLSVGGGVRGARWQTEDQLHLTLRFIGGVDRHGAEDIHAALSSVRHPRFELVLHGLGAFERRGAPTTLWAGVAPQDPLVTLHKKIDLAIARTGHEPERRAYTPHITLARMQRGSGPVAPFLGGAGDLASPPFVVEEFRLYESRLTTEAAVYDVIESYPLD